MKTLNTCNFDWNDQSRFYSVEASEIGAFEESFILKSIATGTETKMVLSGREYDEENEITAWVFTPSPMRPFSLKIFND